MLRHLLRMIGANRVALGSDYPFPLGEDLPGALIDSMSDLDVKTRRQLFADSALEFLARERSAFS
jgi:aminocarboxymuconate-semialdehyde decarboxylase